MTSYAEMAWERRKDTSLYLKLRALDLDLYVKEDLHDFTGYRLAITGLHSLSEAHADLIRQRVERSKLGLLRLLWARWDADLEAIRREGAA